MSRLKSLLTVIGAVTILVLAGNTLAYAATGGKFMLGQVNKANKASTLKRTTDGPALNVVTKSSTAPPLIVNGRGKVTNLNADLIDGVDSSTFVRADSSAFLRGDIVKLSQQHGWLAQFNSSGVVQTYANLEILAGTGAYFLPLTTPNVIDARQYYLTAVEVCYNVTSAGDKISATHVLRSTSNNFPDVDVLDPTARTMVQPAAQCYTMAVNDTAAPAGSVYNLELTVIGTARIVRATSTFSAR